MKLNHILPIFIFLALIPFVNAEAVCFPDNSHQLCTNAFWIDDYLYCDIDDVVQCTVDTSTSPPTGGCYSNPDGDDCCADDVGCVETPHCNEGWERCCSDPNNCDVTDPDGDVYECINGNWKKTDDCDPSKEEKCNEYGSIQAQCEGKKWYCMNHDSLTCYWREGDDNNGLCCETQDQCETNLIHYCLDEDGYCTKRYGQCLPGELYRQGTDIDDEWCASQGTSAECESCWEWFFNKGDPEYSDESSKCNPDAKKGDEIKLDRSCRSAIVFELGMDGAWYNPATWFKVPITQEMWCPFVFIIGGSAILFVLILAGGIIFIMARKSKRKRK